MNEVIKIRLGKKDYIVRTWWDNASKAGITLSSVVNCAVHHYAKTGKYLAIACINNTKQAENSEPSIRQIYLPEESVAYKWLTEKKKGGEKISSTIKRILRNSIVLSENEVLYSEDELKSIIDMIGTEIYEKRLNNQQTINITIPNIESMVYQPDKIMVDRPQQNNQNTFQMVTQQEKKTMESHVEEKEEIVSGVSTKVASWDDEDDDSGGPDLYDALLGGAGLSL